MIRSVSQDGAQTIVFADTFHPSSGIREAVSAPEVMQALSESGITKFTVEGEQALAGIARKYREADAEGKEEIVNQLANKNPYNANNPEIRKQWARGMLDIFAHAENAGLEVAMPDPRYARLADIHRSSDSRTPVGNEMNLSELDRQLTGVVTDPMCASIQTNAFFDSLSPEQQKALLEHKNIQNTVIFDPEANTEIAKKTEDREATPGNRAYIYGIAHTMDDNDLDELSPNAVTIAIAEKPGSEVLLTMLKLGANDIPDYVYYTQEGRVEKLDFLATQEMIFGSRDQGHWELTPEQKDQCDASVKHLESYQQAIEVLKPLHDIEYNAPSGTEVCPQSGVTWEGEPAPGKNCR